MKIRKMVEIITDSFEEQQFILSRFPDSFWFVEGDNKTRFYISALQEGKAIAALNEWKEYNG